MSTGLRFWCPHQLLVTVDGPPGRFSTLVEKPFARVGSHCDCEVVLPDQSVARRGLYLHATGAGVYFLRLAATGSDQTAFRGWLLPGEGARLGPYRIYAEVSGAALPDGPLPQEPDAERSAPDPYPVIGLASGGHEMGRYPLHRRLTVVGRGRVSTMRLPDRMVSVAHCVLYRHGPSLWVVDLLSSNGTRYRGRPVEAAELTVGETVVVGSIEMTYATTSNGHGPSWANAPPSSATPDSSWQVFSSGPLVLGPAVMPEPAPTAGSAWESVPADQSQRGEGSGIDELEIDGPETAEPERPPFGRSGEPRAEHRQTAAALARNRKLSAQRRLRRRAAEAELEEARRSLESLRGELEAERREHLGDRQKWTAERQSLENERAALRAERLQAEKELHQRAEALREWEEELRAKEQALRQRQEAAACRDAPATAAAGPSSASIEASVPDEPDVVDATFEETRDDETGLSPGGPGGPPEDLWERATSGLIAVQRAKRFRFRLIMGLVSIAVLAAVAVAFAFGGERLLEATEWVSSLFSAGG